jgi:membrane-associated phospholipid phosphatase
MLSIIEKNKNYLTLYLLFFFTLFFYQINFYQTDALFFFSHHRSTTLNNIFLFITRLGEEFIYIVLAFWFLYKNERKTILKIIVTGLAVLLISIVLKLIFSHPRPVTFLDEHGVLGKINIVNDYILRGMNSFPSGHTMSAFALFTALALHFTVYKYWQKLLLLTAILVGISRVYLVAHFPEDILLGSALGVFIALGIEYYFTVKLYPPLKELKIQTETNDSIAVDTDSKNDDELLNIEPKLT